LTNRSRDSTIDKKRLSPHLSREEIEYSVINMFNTLTFLLSKPQFILERVRDVSKPSSVGHFRNLSVILSLAQRDNKMQPASCIELTHSCSQIIRQMKHLGIGNDYEFQSALLQKFTQFMSRRLRDY